MTTERNIILTGMPGAGKSTLGVILAKAVNMQFVDTDLLIQKEAGAPLSEIIAAYGIDYFLALEERVVLRLDLSGHVIATGGSVVYGARAMRHLRNDGITVYLRLGYDQVEERVLNITGRGVVIRDGQSLYDLYLERIPLYERYADIVVDCAGKNIEKTLADMIRALQPALCR